MRMSHYKRNFENVLKERLREKPHFIQVIQGPRQVGKTSGTQNVLQTLFSKKQYNFFSCEEGIHNHDWFLQQVQKTQNEKKKIIVFDEIQKIDRWSDLVKLAWDKQKREGALMHWILLGSSSLQLSIGLGDSLAGRFETIPVHHWNYNESKTAFGLTLDEYILFGGYPASYLLKDNPERFKNYIFNSIFETVISRDILRYVTVKKPALFRQTFINVCQFPAQELSYNKLLGQLQEAGNVDQIKHYLDLFYQAFLLRLIFKFSKTKLSRSSSPKLLPAAPTFTHLFLQRNLSPEEKGRVFECIVGNRLCENFDAVYYWRDGMREIDFVVDTGKNLIGIEVKSKQKKIAGAQIFRSKFKNGKICFVNFENYLEFEANPRNFLEKYAT